MRARKKKASKRTPTTLVRVSWAMWELVRREAKQRGMSMRALGDASVLAYLNAHEEGSKGGKTGSGT